MSRPIRDVKRLLFYHESVTSRVMIGDTGLSVRRDWGCGKTKLLYNGVLIIEAFVDGRVVVHGTISQVRRSVYLRLQKVLVENLERVRDCGTHELCKVRLDCEPITAIAAHALPANSFNAFARQQGLLKELIND